MRKIYAPYYKILKDDRLNMCFNRSADDIKQQSDWTEWAMNIDEATLNSINSKIDIHNAAFLLLHPKGETLDHLTADQVSEFRMGAILTSRYSPVIKKFGHHWGTWLSESSENEYYRKIAALGSQINFAAGQYKGWSEWAGTDDARINRILVSKSTQVIRQLKNLNQWVQSDPATADQKRFQILKTRCNHAINQLTLWKQWACRNPTKKHAILKSYNNKSIKELGKDTWKRYARTDERKNHLLKSCSKHAITALSNSTWKHWIDSKPSKKKERTVQLLRSSCTQAQGIISWGRWAGKSEERWKILSKVNLSYNWALYAGSNQSKLNLLKKYKKVAWDKIHEVNTSYKHIEDSSTIESPLLQSNSTDNCTDDASVTHEKKNFIDTSTTQEQLTHSEQNSDSEDNAELAPQNTSVTSSTPVHSPAFFKIGKRKSPTLSSAINIDSTGGASSLKRIRL